MRWIEDGTKSKDQQVGASWDVGWRGWRWSGRMRCLGGKGGAHGEDEGEGEAVGRRRGGRWEQGWKKAGGRLAFLLP